jgi:hypothetical protein
MSYTPIPAAQLAVQLAHHTAGSARPDAPVVPDRAPRGPRAAGLRAALAAELRAVARWVEPSARRSKVCQPG